MICGPIGHGGFNEIKRMSDFLEQSGFEIIKQFEKDRMNYSHVRDFRRKITLSRSIVKHDLQAVKNTDVLVILPKPSFGASIEMYVGKTLGKKIILFSHKAVPSPWPVQFADHIVTSKESLVRKLREIVKKNSSKR